MEFTLPGSAGVHSIPDSAGIQMILVDARPTFALNANASSGVISPSFGSYVVYFVNCDVFIVCYGDGGGASRRRSEPSVVMHGLPRGSAHVRETYYGLLCSITASTYSDYDRYYPSGIDATLSIAAQRLSASEAYLSNTE